MRAKYIPQKTNQRYRFFLLMTVPFFLGLLIALISLAHGEWDRKDEPSLRPSPITQGWIPFEEQVIPSQETPLITG
jgi:hypothetical protein